MSRFQTLSEHLLHYHQIVQQDRSPLDTDRRTGAGMLAVLAHGPLVMQISSLVNTAGLALAQERLIVHRLDAAAIAQVMETDVRTLPSDPPRLLRSGFVIETADLSRPLYADVVNLGGYAIEGDAWLIGLQYPDGIFVGHWRPRWGDADVEASFVQDYSAFVMPEQEHRELTIEGVQFALTLGALLDAEGTPLGTSTERMSTSLPKRQPAPKQKAPYTWNVRHITLQPSAVPQSAPAPAEAEIGAERTGLHPEKRRIRGFLRRQPFGPGRQERKWVYIASFESVRYVGVRPLRVRVSGEEREA